MAKFGIGRRGSSAAPKPPQSPKPKKERFKRLKQIKQVYDLARRNDPKLPWLMWGAALGILLVGFLIGLALGHPYYATFIALPLAVLAATFILSRRAEKAAYGALDGQPGAGGAALQGLRRGWSYQQEPVAVDGGRGGTIAGAAMVYRAVGRPGVVLIGEGPSGRAQKLLATEQKRVNRLVPNVPVITFRVGTGSGENVVSTRELVTRMGKLKKQLTKQEVAAVDKRLRALGKVRPPVPQGIDPQRMRSMGRGQRR